MTGPYTVTLIEHTLTKIESGNTMRYGVPIAHVPLNELARRLGITATALLKAMGKDTTCRLASTATLPTV